MPTRRPSPSRLRQAVAELAPVLPVLTDLGERFAIQAIVPTSYGSTAALIDATELVLPIVEYATDPPPELAAGSPAAAALRRSS